eukprot:356141-Chlamydomonas_euryale.AAC.3
MSCSTPNQHQSIVTDLYSWEGSSCEDHGHCTNAYDSKLWSLPQSHEPKYKVMNPSTKACRT